MEILYACCCGIDVHARMLVACLIKDGKKEVRTFSTMTDDLLLLLDWLSQQGCTHIAIESTGVYWKPVFNILEGAMEVILTNARDAKGFKARKTDVNESAGKRKSGKTSKGSRYVRAALVQAAWVASHQKGTYLAAQYQRLVKRMGKKKALVAVGHSILVMVYQVLTNRASYQEMGGDYFERRNVEKQKNRLIRQLEALGLKVTVEEMGFAA
jgi:hypothetical protein